MKKPNVFNVVYCKIHYKHPDWSKKRIRSSTLYALRGNKNEVS